MRNILLICTAAGVLSAQAPPPRFTVIDLGILAGKAVSQATAISSNGTVVGYSSTAGYAFGQGTGGAAQSWIWSNGVQTPMDANGPTIPLGINASGQIIGITTPILGQFAPTPFFYLNGVFNTPEDLAGGSFGFPEPVAISDAGPVAFTNAPLDVSVGNRGPFEQAGVWANGTLTVLPIPSNCPALQPGTNITANPNFCTTRATSISANGQYVAGWAYYWNQNSYEAALWSNGQLKTFGQHSVLTGVNNAGQSVGYLGARASLFDNNGNVTDLGTGWAPTAMNNTGWVVGNDRGIQEVGQVSVQPVDLVISPGEGNAILWANNTEYNLNSCSCISNSAGWEFDFAYAVNDAGQIVGTGFHNGVETGFLLNPEPAPALNAVVNGASFAPGGVVAGAMATAFGTNLTSGTGINITSSLPLPNNFLMDTLMVNNHPAALFAVDNVNGQQQINFQVPWEVAAGPSATIVAMSNGTPSAAITVPVLAAQPGIFNYTVGGDTFGAILHANFQLADTAHPAEPGEIVLIYCTGLGAVANLPADGDAGNGQETRNSPTVTIGGSKAAVSFSGLAPGFVGLYQVNAQVPATLAKGNQAVTIEMAAATSNLVLLPLQ
jgi:uncharacterized protein (TIGR03437 family)